MTDSPKTPDSTPTNGSHERMPVKQFLGWLTGDRTVEANALAEQTAEHTDLTPDEALVAATDAVADAHGDLGIDHTSDDSPADDIARPADVLKEADLIKEADDTSP
jgi:hypothetical protein